MKKKVNCKYIAKNLLTKIIKWKFSFKNLPPKMHIKLRWQNEILKLLLRNFYWSRFLYNIIYICNYDTHGQITFLVQAEASFPHTKAREYPHRYFAYFTCPISCDFNLPVQMYYLLSPTLSFTFSGKCLPIFMSCLVRLNQSN